MWVFFLSFFEKHVFVNYDIKNFFIELPYACLLSIKLYTDFILNIFRLQIPSVQNNYQISVM